MRLFISEYVCSGAVGGTSQSPRPLDDPWEDSLVAEGRAMLFAVLEDAARVPGWEICTTWDRRLGVFPLPNVGVVMVDRPAEEREIFARLVAQCDATYVIAPELDEQLGRRCLAVVEAGGRSLNSHAAAIRLCSDKLELARRWQERGWPTIPTAPLTPEAAPSDRYPLVLKPRFGAGSHETHLISRPRDLERLQPCFHDEPETRQGIVQPYVPGRPISVAAIFDDQGRTVDVWPVAEQWLSGDGRFAYLAGQVPADEPCREAIETLVRAAGEDVGGLRGYIGFDLLLPDLNPHAPLLVEINPRLTTSYLGYRVLAGANLAPYVLGLDAGREPVKWRMGEDNAPVRSVWTAAAEWEATRVPAAAAEASATSRN